MNLFLSLLLQGYYFQQTGGVATFEPRGDSHMKRSGMIIGTFELNP